MKNFNKTLQWLVLVSAVAWLVYFFTNNYRVYDRANRKVEHVAPEKTSEENQMPLQKSLSIEKLTAEDVVINYVREHGKLPDYYITKNDAHKQGWDASKGNLCDVLPEKAIGGDRFNNRERHLPDKKGRLYFEADLNCHCDNRNADRLVFSNDGLIFVSYDHYKSFVKK